MPLNNDNIQPRVYGRATGASGFDNQRLAGDNIASQPMDAEFNDLVDAINDILERGDFGSIRIGAGSALAPAVNFRGSTGWYRVPATSGAVEALRLSIAGTPVLQLDTDGVSLVRGGTLFPFVVVPSGAGGANDLLVRQGNSFVAQAKAAFLADTVVAYTTAIDAASEVITAALTTAREELTAEVATAIDTASTGLTARLDLITRATNTPLVLAQELENTEFDVGVGAGFEDIVLPEVVGGSGFEDDALVYKMFLVGLGATDDLPVSTLDPPIELDTTPENAHSTTLTFNPATRTLAGAPLVRRPISLIYEATDVNNFSHSTPLIINVVANPRIVYRPGPVRIIYRPNPRPSPDNRTCFPANTLVRMADSTYREIADVHVGDRVQGYKGINTVLAYDRVRIGDHADPRLHTINDKLATTSDHLLYSARGWGVLDYSGYEAYHGKTLDCVFDADLNPTPTVFEGLSLDSVGELGVGDRLVRGIKRTSETLETIVDISPHTPDPDITVYSLVCDGDGSMLVTKQQYVVSAWVSTAKWGGGEC